MNQPTSQTISSSPRLLTRWALVLLLFVVLVVGCQSHNNSSSSSPTGNIASDAVHDYGQNVHNSLEAAKKTECASNLTQLRQAIQMQKDSNGANPASLDELGTQLKSIETCPSSGQPYRYDPSTGKVWCATPGHEKL